MDGDFKWLSLHGQFCQSNDALDLASARYIIAKVGGVAQSLRGENVVHEASSWPLHCTAARRVLGS